MFSCVLTTGKGQWLWPMAEGLVNRYKNAGIPPPVVLYTDRDYCERRNIVARLFPEWPRTKVCLDVCHFMRRLASCCTTEEHLLYGEFLDRLSTCIFEWDDGDLRRLRDAKRSQMEEVGLMNKSFEAVMRTLQKKELALHCRPQTRGVKTTTQLLEKLLSHYTGPGGHDMAGLPLLDEERTWGLWAMQKNMYAAFKM